MYNHYTPQPDGSYRRNRVPDHSRKTPQRSVPPKQEGCPPPPPEKGSCPPPIHEPCPQPRQESCPKKQAPCQTGNSVGSFLKQLLPRDFDTSDLLIILLLLLIAGDCPEDQNNALLTLAIYLFL